MVHGGHYSWNLLEPPGTSWNSFSLDCVCVFACVLVCACVRAWIKYSDNKRTYLVNISLSFSCHKCFYMKTCVIFRWIIWGMLSLLNYQLESSTMLLLNVRIVSFIYLQPHFLLIFHFKTVTQVKSDLFTKINTICMRIA